MNEFKVSDRVCVRTHDSDLMGTVEDIIFSFIEGEDDYLFIKFDGREYVNCIPVGFCLKIEEEIKIEQFKVGDRVHIKTSNLDITGTVDDIKYSIIDGENDYIGVIFDEIKHAYEFFPVSDCKLLDK